MPRVRRTNISRSSRRAVYNRERRAQMSQEEHEVSTANQRAQMAQYRSNRTHEQRTQDNNAERLSQQQRRSNRMAATRNVVNRARSSGNFRLNRAAFQYVPTIDYSDHPVVRIGLMDVVCNYCNAMKFKGETNGFCCLQGKIVLPPLSDPPEPLKSLLLGETADSRHFLKKIQIYNGSFQMTSFGANLVHSREFTTFKVISGKYTLYLLSISISAYTIQVQGQISHRIGALLPSSNAEHKFLQIYFIGNSDSEVSVRNGINVETRPDILRSLQDMLHEHHALIQLFKTALDRMPSDDYKVIIRADKRPTGTHERQFNAPTIDEVAVVIVGENVQSRDIVLFCRNAGELKRISETHRSYDALQYPLMMWRGEDGYSINIKMVDPATG